MHVLLTADALSSCLDLPGTGAPATPGSWDVAVDPTGTRVDVTGRRLGRTFTIDINEGSPTLRP